MKKKTWIKNIKQCCEDAGTYKPFFDDVIETLATILETRDFVYEQYLESGQGPVIEYTNKSGATNPSKNPYLSLFDEYNKTALAYWRDLGLTPKGLKAIDETALKERKKDPFTEALKIVGL